MEKPILVVMAAGMGSRYGGLKQIEPVGRYGETIMDYSLYDAHRAGFEKVIFIINRSVKDVFAERIGNHISDYMAVGYAFQELDDLPKGYSPPKGREKPWGTGHAVLAARNMIRAPFAVINADDYYGPQCFQAIYDFLCTHRDDKKYRYCMVGYLLKNTVTENGSVARGICTVDADEFLTSVVEHTQIEPYENGIHFSDDGGETWTDIDENAIVSMNLWGFSESFIKEAKKRFSGFLDKAMESDPIRGEYFLPSVVTQLLSEQKATVKVLPCLDRWHGITYREDRPRIVRALADLTEKDFYPSPLWKWPAE